MPLRLSLTVDYLYLYIAIVAVATVLYVRRQRRMQTIHAAKLETSVLGGMVEPPSLHPVVDHARCIGSGACVKVCPEQALGIVGGKAVLVNAAACIGHGACRLACPVEAISLVFGTAKRGIDIPDVSPEFESNLPGIFIAGELGGMGLIRKACEQGRQAIDSIRKRRKSMGKAGQGEYDVVIVGAGPAGFSAGLAAMQHRLRYKLIEQEDSLGGAVYHYPRQKITMSAPVRLALIGKVKFGEVEERRSAQILGRGDAQDRAEDQFRERMEGITPAGDAFVVTPTRRIPCPQRAAHAGPAWHAAQARCSGRRVGQGGVPAHRSGAVPLAGGARRRRRRQRARSGDRRFATARQRGDDLASPRHLLARETKNRKLLEESQAAGRVHVVLKSK